MRASNKDLLRRWLGWLALLLLTLGSPAWPEGGEGKEARTRTGNPGQPFPEIDVRKDPKLKTITDLMLGMGVTEPVYTPEQAKKAGVPLVEYADGISFGREGQGYHLYNGVSLVDLEVRTALDFLEGKGRFASLKGPKSARGMILLRYGMDTGKAVELLNAFKAEGAHSAVLITDGNTTMNEKKASFPTEPGESTNFTNDIRPEYLKPSGQGKAVRELLDNGYELRSPVFNASGRSNVETGDFFVALSALYRNQTIGPIMHHKEMLLYELKDPKKPVSPDNIKALYVQHGTGNWTRVHYNRTYFYQDGGKGDLGLGRNALEHALRAIDNFTRPDSSARMNQTQTPNRFRQEAKDGTFWEVAYTDGKYELNYRMVEFFQDVAKNPKKYRINEVVLSHFVFTNRNVLHAIFDAWVAMKEAGRPFKVTGVLDEKFVGMRNWGIAAAMEDYAPRSPFGHITKGLGKEFADAVEINVVHREREGAKNIDPEGYPSHRHLWHDKTTMVDWQPLDPRTGKPLDHYLEAWTGSYNNSNNRNNMERQDRLRMRRDSPLAHSLYDSVWRVRDQYRAQGHAVRMEGAILLKVLAEFVGQWQGDMDQEKVKRVVKLLTSKADYDSATLREAEKLLLELHGDTKSRMASPFRVTKATLKKKITILKKFLKWYSGLPDDMKGFRPEISPQEFVGVVISLADSPYGAKSALTYLLWRPGLPRHKLLSRARQAYDEMGLRKYYEGLGMNGDFPPDRVAGLPLAELTASDVAELVEGMHEGNFKEVARRALELARKSPEFRVEGKNLLSEEKVAERLSKLMAFLDWYHELPLPGDRRNYEREKWKLLPRMMNEDLGLLLLKSGHESALVDTLRHFIRLRGFPKAEAQRLAEQAQGVLGFPEPSSVAARPEIVMGRGAMDCRLDRLVELLK